MSFLPSSWSYSSPSMVIIFFLVLVIPFHGNHFFLGLGSHLPSDHLFEFWRPFLSIGPPLFGDHFFERWCLFLGLGHPFLGDHLLKLCHLFLVLVVPFLVIISLNCRPLPSLGDPPLWTMMPSSPPWSSSFWWSPSLRSVTPS